MESRTSHKFAKRYLLIILLIILLNVAAFVGFYYYNQYQTVLNKSNPNVAAQKEVQDLVTKVGKLILLPKGETPTVATVNDASKLKSQAFFANASNGDKVLIYMKEKKAILYDPVANLIIDVAPVNDQTQPASTTASAKPVVKTNKLVNNITVTPTPTVVIVRPTASSTLSPIITTPTK